MALVRSVGTVGGCSRARMGDSRREVEVENLRTAQPADAGVLGGKCELGYRNDEPATADAT